MQLNSDQFPVLVNQLTERVVLSALCALFHKGTISDNARTYIGVFTVI